MKNKKKVKQPKPKKREIWKEPFNGALPPADYQLSN